MEKDNANIQIRDKLIDLFKFIESERMADIPVLNKELSVDAFGFESQDGYHFGVLLTPWFMNLVLIPTQENGDALDDSQVGSKTFRILPSGRFEFIAGYEEKIGMYLSCSLFSPVFEFADQQAAVETALAILEQVNTPIDEDGEEEVDEDADMREIWAGRLPEPEPIEVEEHAEQIERKPVAPQKLSRRELLRGGKKQDAEHEAGQQS